jgi:hypothetical protein
MLCSELHAFINFCSQKDPIDIGDFLLRNFTLAFSHSSTRTARLSPALPTWHASVHWVSSHGHQRHWGVWFNASDAVCRVNLIFCSKFMPDVLNFISTSHIGLTDLQGSIGPQLCARHEACPSRVWNYIPFALNSTIFRSLTFLQLCCVHDAIVRSINRGFAAMAVSYASPNCKFPIAHLPVIMLFKGGGCRPSCLLKLRF